MLKSVTECKYWDIKTYDCLHEKGPIYCGKYDYDIPEDCPINPETVIERSETKRA